MMGWIDGIDWYLQSTRGSIVVAQEEELEAAWVAGVGDRRRIWWCLVEMDRWDGCDDEVGCFSVGGWLKARWMRAVVGRRRKTRG